MIANVRNKQINTIFAAILVFFALFIVIPAFLLFKNAFTVGSGISLENFRMVFERGQLAKAFANSVTVSIISALITTLLAFILAYTEEFTNIPEAVKKMIRTLAVFPMLLPTITYGFAIIYSFGRNGLITKLIGRQIFDFYGFRGLIFGYVIYTLPISFTLIKNTMSYIDKRYLVVTRVMGDNRLKSFYTAVLQPLWGTVAVSIVQAFFLSFTDFGIPSSIGGRYVVVAELLYNTMLGAIPNFHQGAVIAIMMLLPSVLSILLLNYLKRFNVRYNKISRIDLEVNVLRDVVFCALSWIILLFVLSIFLVVFVAPFVAEWPYNKAFTLRHLGSVFADKALVRVFTNSLWISLLTAVLGTAFVYAAALVTARSRIHPHGNMMIESAAQITNTIPGMVLGIAFLLCFRGTILHNTIWIIIFCNMIHFFATPYLMMKSTLDKMNSSWETTATILGDNWIKTVVRIITPNAVSTLLEVFCYLFINGMVTVSAVVFIAGARTMVITTKIQELQHFARFNEIFILSLLILLTNLLIKTVKGILNKRK
ncbi:MAG: ABC transporter permease subunit [Treponema sp.]|jgi:iron(III) transport system permease protein|nr:ABC transporter permease subunit [Treponema sp.]